MDDLDTPKEPVEGQIADGQVETPAEKPEEGSSQPDVDARLAQLERDYKELQRDYTRKAQRLAELNRSQPQHTQGSTPAPAPEEFDWANPGASIKRYVGETLAEFERRQEQKRMADQLVTDTAEQYGIPPKELQRYYAKLADAATDPVELMETVARMYRADHTDKAITDARREAQQTVERNARGVTSQSGATKPTGEQKPFEKMSDEELDTYVKREYGVADWPT